jgi:RNA polymerase sigma-70 factor, ECF subfamily
MDSNSLEFLQELDAAQHDDRLWGKLLDRYRSRLRSMIDLRMHALVRGRVDPSDVIQEAFVDASQRLPEFVDNPTVPFYVWLRSLASQRLSLAHRRNLGVQARNAGREVSIFHSPFPAATSAIIAAQLVGHLTSPSSAAIAAEQKLKLQSALDELEPIDREILVLRHFEEITNAEAAAVLGLRPTAANNRYIRALGRLKSALDRRVDHPSEFCT